MSFPRILEECMGGYVNKLWVIDDSSIDGSYVYLYEVLKNIIPRLPCESHIIQLSIGNSVGHLNYVLENSDADYFIKIDNDIVIPAGYVEALLAIMTMDESLAFLMMGECSGFPFIEKPFEYVYRPSNHIGGVGMFKGSLMRDIGIVPTEARFFGFTGYQQRLCKQFNKKCGQMTRAGNMNLDISCYSRAKHYADRGWGRLFSSLPYDNGVL